MSTPVAAINTLLKIGDGAQPEVFTTVAQVKSISGPSLSVESTDVTTHSNTTPWREFVPTLLDAGELSFELNFVPATDTLLTKLTSRSINNYRLVFPDTPATTWEFKGFVTNFDMEAAVDSVLSASVTIKLTGQPTFTGVV